MMRQALRLDMSISGRSNILIKSLTCTSWCDILIVSKCDISNSEVSVYGCTYKESVCSDD